MPFQKMSKEFSGKGEYENTFSNSCKLLDLNLILFDICKKINGIYLAELFRN